MTTIIHVCDECNTTTDGDVCAEHPGAEILSIATTAATITGRLAIAIAETFGIQLRKHADPTDRAREIDADEAREIITADPSLVYVDSAEVADAVPLTALAALRLEAIEADDTAQRIICDMAIDGEDSLYGEDCLDADGRPDYSGGGHGSGELAAIRRALRLTQAEARVECARVIAAAQR